MIDSAQAVFFFGTSAGFWIAGYAWGKAVAWTRHLVNAS